MRLALDVDTKLPYLDQQVIKDFSNITIISEDNERFQINPVLLLSWIRIGGAIHFVKDDKPMKKPMIKVLDDHFSNFFVLDSFANLFIGGFFCQSNSQVNDGDIRCWYSESHTSQFSIQFWNDLNETIL